MYGGQYARLKQKRATGSSRGFKTGLRPGNYGYSQPRNQARLIAARAPFRQAARSSASRARAANLQTAGFLGIETKFYDTALAATPVATSADMTGGEYDPSATSMISTPAQGDGEQNRDGKKIVVKNVQLKGTLSRVASEDAVDPPAPEKVFVALVLDTQSNAAQMNSEDCFKNLANTPIASVTPMRNLLYNNRFRILKSDIFDLDAKTLGVEGNNLHSAAGLSCTFDWYVDLKSLPILFNAGTTSSIANVVDNSIHVIAFSVSGAATLTYNARIRFVG